MCPTWAHLKTPPSVPGLPNSQGQHKQMESYLPLRKLEEKWDKTWGIRLVEITPTGFPFGSQDQRNCITKSGGQDSYLVCMAYLHDSLCCLKHRNSQDTTYSCISKRNPLHSCTPRCPWLKPRQEHPRKCTANFIECPFTGLCFSFLLIMVNFVPSHDLNP